MKKGVLFFFVVFVSLTIFGQNKKKDQEVDIINHEVQLGESIRLISKKYLVDPAEIYKLNKFAVEGISAGMVLKIPVPRKEGAIIAQQESEMKPLPEQNAPVEKIVEEKTIIAPNLSNNAEITKEQLTTVIDRNLVMSHTVAAKETLFSLSKKYAITVDEIKLNNPQLAKGGLKIGQVIKIPSTVNNEPVVGSNETPSYDTANSQTMAQTTQNNTVKHTVIAKETLYSLSKKYDVPVSEIKQQNESLLQNGLKIGQVLTIKKNN